MKQIKYLRKTVDPILCNTLQEALMAYFNSKPLPKAMLRIRRQENKRYELSLDEQYIIGWDNNILRGKFATQ